MVSARTSSTALTGDAADIDGDGDYDLVVGNADNEANEIFIFEHCPSAVRVGTSQVCMDIPNYAKRSHTGDIAIECPAHYRRSTEVAIRGSHCAHARMHVCMFPWHV